ncbi:hypothetical protein PAXINDRAFT_20276 [Paxillus involutus ATCC 200175]|uniref:Winged helix-turn helix domain-containing protein n=1 Tax=Paxillus involutus ATCC 200175 TaxID=664439 RepID=A0A0C9TGX7_PAXIN|nr:hypothetical protein PAXINDRAFT_20276 [Paxillus involutus ATCC 200175]
MPQGQKTSSEIQWAIIRLARMLDQDQISAALNVSNHTVQRVQAYFCAYGMVPNEDNQPEKRDRTSNRHFQDVDVEFLLGTIEKALDLYLDDLQEMLAVSCGVQVTCLTVWRTLHSKGFTMKKKGAPKNDWTI